MNFKISMSILAAMFSTSVIKNKNLRLSVSIRGSEIGMRAVSALVITACLMLPLAAPGADDAIRTFIWEQANAQAMTADKPADYLAAAATYNRLALDGVRNGLLFINLGNVLVMGGDDVNAAAAFSRAERYVGATPETRHGLAAALTLQTGRRQSDLPWSRAAFFWHYAFSCPVRAMAALTGWSVFWFGMLLLILLRRGSRHPLVDMLSTSVRNNNHPCLSASIRGSEISMRAVPALVRSLSETCLVTGGLLMIVFGASVLMTIAHERHDQETWATRVFASTAHGAEESAP